MQFHSRTVFQRSTLNEFNEIDVSRIAVYFHTPSIVVSQAFAIDLNAAMQHFKQRVDEFTKLVSGYILEYVDQLSVSFVLQKLVYIDFNRLISVSLKLIIIFIHLKSVFTELKD